MKTLIDGRQVHGNSEAWRHECEARTVLDMPLSQRGAFLEGDGHSVLKKRGPEAVARLKATMNTIWVDRQARALLPLSKDEQDQRLSKIATDARGERLRQGIEARMAELISAGRVAANDDQVKVHKAM